MWPQALSHLKQISEENYERSIYHYGVAIGKKLPWPLSLCLLKELTEQQIRCSVVASNSLANYGWHLGVALLGALRAHGMQVNGQSYTPILRHWPASAMLLDLRRHLKVSVIHYNSLISCLGRWRLALDSLQQMAQRLEPSLASYNASMSSYAWPIAFKELRGMRSNVVTFTAIMGHTHWSSATYLLKELRRRNIEPNALSCTSCISSCADVGHWTAALQLLSLSWMLPGCNAAISGMEKGGRWQQAIELLAKAALNGLRHDVVSLNAALSACNGGAAWNRALDLLNKLGSRLQLDIITMNACISAAEKNQLWELALLLLAKAIHVRRSVDESFQLLPGC